MFKWLARCGYLYNIVTTPVFKLMIQSLTCNLEIEIISRDRYSDLLEGDFSLFSKSVQNLLETERKKALNERFLNFLHDIWTNANSAGIVGVFVAFIDSSWTWRYIAVLATLKNDGCLFLS